MSDIAYKAVGNDWLWRQPQLTLFRNGLPDRPYTTNDCSQGLFIRDASTALKNRYIQPNHPNSKLWLMFDIDRPTSPEELTDDRGASAP